MKRDEIVQYLKDNPGWVLQFQWAIGIDRGFWWLRNMKAPSETIKVDGRSARAAKQLLKRDGAFTHGSNNYVLR